MVISWSKQRAEAFKALSPFNLLPVWASVKKSEGVGAALVLMSKSDPSQPLNVCLKGRLEPQKRFEVSLTFHTWEFTVDCFEFCTFYQDVL